MAPVVCKCRFDKLTEFELMETTNAIQQIYIGLLGRAADQEGLQYWTDEIEAGTLTLEQLRANIVEEQPEYEATFGGQTRAQVVSQLYANLFNRAPDDEGLQYWVNGEGAGVNIDQLVLALVNGASAADTLVLDNRTEVANTYTTELGAEGSFDADLAAAVIADVDGTRASVEQAEAAIENGDIEAPTQNEGDTFTLTDAIGENVVGTAGNDTFGAVLDNSNAATLNVGDTVDGKGGNDTLNLLVTSGETTTNTTGNLPAGASISNVEVLNVTYADNGHLGALDSADFAGVKQLWQVDNDDAAAEFQDVTVAADVTAGFRSTGDRATAVVATASVNAASGNQKSASVALDGVADGSAITFAGGDLETINVSGSVTTAAPAATTNRLTVTDTADTETANISLSSDTTVTLTDAGGAGDSITTVDLSGSEGDITLDATALTALTSLTGGEGADDLTVDLESGEEISVDAGAGNDTVTLNNTTAGSNVASTVALGGGKDTLVVQSISNINDADEAAFEAGIIEVTDFNIGDDTLDLNTNGVVLTTAQLDNAEGEASLFDAIGYIDGLTNGGDVAVFNYDGNAYVYANDGGDGFNGGEGLIQLTGVDATQFSTDQDGGLVL
ncbi:DUF4214 domain-containing protein [Halomonas sp. CUBES01]|uniref:DUF4214 domain-containing protein n=1 Tax=Halomonas sp. CUBES01 TaxID=2897340 RepID=UPI001E53E11B|nr:DUF4214 domain-containing protein [Halomonas sp. CUBES01]MEC4766706.1 DUF4214 domain-containing protein [Halomonas sp. CUBES01]